MRMDPWGVGQEFKSAVWGQAEEVEIKPDGTEVKVKIRGGMPPGHARMLIPGWAIWAGVGLLLILLLRR